MSNTVSNTEEVEPEKVYYCRVCGYGYTNEALSRECEEYCSTHNSCSLQITFKAIRKPN